LNPAESGTEEIKGAGGCIMLTALTNVIIYTDTETLGDKALLIKNDIIEAITDTESVPETAEVIDCEGNYLSPGFIDLQIAGAGGYLFSASPTAEALKAIAGAITVSGTTGFLIAIPTNTMEVYHEVIKIVRENPHPAVLGLHIEGPFLSPVRRGAHLKELIKPPRKKDVEALIAEGEGVVKMLTVAPEVCDREIIELLNDNGIIVAAGHSNATFKEAVQGFKWLLRLKMYLPA
jgi:N-acetylglucosamine-6-phosphate deacetylase